MIYPSVHPSTWTAFEGELTVLDANMKNSPDGLSVQTNYPSLA